MAKETTPEWADEKFITRNYGITRTPLYNLRKAGLIRSVALRAEGAAYGKRLYHISSIEAHLAACEAREAQTEAVAGRTK
jgi:hypothetical protein